MAELFEQTESLQGTLTVHDLDVIIQRLDSLPTFPCVISRVVEFASQATSASGRDVRESARAEALGLIASDPALTARVLAYAARQTGAPVPTIARAADAVGFDAIRSIVLSADTIDESEPSCGVDRSGLYKHSLAAALAAEMIARALGSLADPKEAYVCGLLHDLGKLMLAHCMPKSFQRVIDTAETHHGNVQEYERRIIGVEHSVIGRRLAERWRLPDAVGETLWLCHQPIETIGESATAATTVAVVSLADTLVRELRLGFSENHAPSRTSEQMADRLGLSRDALAGVAGALADETERRYAALGLDDIDAPDANRDALARANTELGRLNERLQRSAGEMSQEAAAFGHLRRFAESLSPRSTVSDVLLRAAETLAAALGCEPMADRPVVAYAATPREQTALAVRIGGDDDAQWRTFPAPAPRREGAEAPPRSAGAVIALLARDPADLTEWVDLADYAHQGLVSAGQWIGGVFYRPPQGPPRAGDQVAEAIGATVALALAIVQGRSAAMRVSEQLAGASQVLAATQEVIAEAKTLATVGEMAAGAAHELNTPLAVISGRAQLMRERASTEKEGNTWQLIADQAHCISDIISELMAFASPPTARITRFSIGDLLNNVIEEFCSQVQPQDAAPHVDIHVAEDIPRIRADREQVYDAVLELMTNAATAGDGRGRIRLEAEFDEVNEAVVLKVEDFGPGMDEKTADRAFTPFFSSQKAGRRRGMGLPRVKRVVENNGGRVWLKTQRGEGTTVFIMLPTT